MSKLDAARAKEARKSVTEKLAGMEQYVQLMEWAVDSGMNLLFYGPPGYAKTMFSNLWLSSYYNEFSQIDFNPSIRLTAILGEYNVKTLVDEGKVEYLLQESPLAKYDGLLFDELFDAPPTVLEALKSALMNGSFCDATGVCIDVKTKTVVGATNRNPFNWTSEGGSELKNSREAVLARFAIIKEFAWETHEISQYEAVLKASGLYDKNVLPIVALYNENSSVKMSPRDCTHIARMYKTGGYPAVAAFRLFDFNVRSKILNVDSEVRKLFGISDLLSEIHQKVVYEKPTLNQNEIKAWLAVCEETEVALKKLMVRSEYLKVYSDATSRLAKIKEALDKASNSVTSMPAHIISYITKLQDVGKHSG